MPTSKKPLIVDLDGTLIKTDLLLESFLRLLKMNPLNLFQAILWLRQGKAHLKSQIAARIDLPVQRLPYHQELIAYLKAEKQQGREIVLATASHRKYADAVAAHLGIFNDVLATDESVNLSGDAKRDVLTRCYGKKQFVYAGNARVDLKVWEHCTAAVVVGSDRLAAQAGRLCCIEKHFLP